MIRLGIQNRSIDSTKSLLLSLTQQRSLVDCQSFNSSQASTALLPDSLPSPIELPTMSETHRPLVGKNSK
jgi:hypothetical protein